ncbi:hypothetical protein BDV93DRAFT_565420 [Ceratobasidium sp. AG-I]|nr:hypothetical protein BDV93DRAFT_565420 [Ceratobasidium sp. AG-I]
MPKTTWDDDEAQFLKQSVKEWESYSGSNRNVGSDDPLNAFISDLVNKFYQRFPDRDVDQQPESDRLFTQEQRNQLAKARRAEGHKYQQKDWQQDDNCAIAF